MLQIDEGALLVSTFIVVVALYRALAARRAAVGRYYRDRALWTAAISAYLALVEVEALLGDLGELPFGPPYSSSLPSAAFYLLFFGFGLAIVWIWIDRSISVALDLDFLHRDLLSWKGGMRYVMGGTWLFAAVFGVFVPSSGILTDLLDLLLGVPLAYAAAALVIGFTRVRDELLRGYSKWIGVVVLALIATGITFPYGFPYILVSYSLYRMAGSLSLREKMGPAVQRVNSQSDRRYP